MFDWGKYLLKKLSEKIRRENFYLMKLCKEKIKLI